MSAGKLDGSRGDSIFVRSSLFDDAKVEVLTNNSYVATLAIVNSRGAPRQGCHMRVKISAYYEGTATKVKNLFSPETVDLHGREEVEFTLVFKETSAKHGNKKFYLVFTVDAPHIQAFRSESFAVTCSFKIVIVGDGGVGKSSMLACYTSAKEERSGDVVNSWRAEVDHNNERIVLHMWDTGGMSEHKSLHHGVAYKGTGMFLVCFAINDRASFDRVPDWIKHIKGDSATPINFGLLGLKRDLRPDQSSSVHGPYVLEDEGRQMAYSVGALFYLECSTSEPGSCKTVFVDVVEILASRREQRSAGCRGCEGCVVS